MQKIVAKHLFLMDYCIDNSLLSGGLNNSLNSLQLSQNAKVMTGISKGNRITPELASF